MSGPRRMAACFATTSMSRTRDPGERLGDVTASSARLRRFNAVAAGPTGGVVHHLIVIIQSDLQKTRPIPMLQHLAPFKREAQVKLWLQ
jgi:hypothetical protein